jgi:transposase
MVKRGELTDEAWARIAPLLPENGRRGRPPGFDRELYAKRNVVERCVGRLKQWRGVATRYEKRAVNYRAMVVIAALMIWLFS